MVGIYAIRNVINNKVYIGQSVNIEKRWKEHKSALKRGVHGNPYLQAAWNKSPRDFEFNVLCECKENELNSLELYYIQQYNATDYRCGYNIQGGGDSIHHQSESTKQKISSKNSGKVYSDELKKYYSDAHNHEKISVICIETQEVFTGLKQLERNRGYRVSGIINCCIFSYASVRGLDNSDVIKVNQKTAYGYHWAYYDDFQNNPNLYFDFVNNDLRNYQRKVYYVEGHIAYDNVHVLSKEMNIPIRNLYAVITGSQKSTHGKHFCFYDDYLGDKEYYNNISRRQGKLTKRAVICLETGEVFESGHDAGKKYGVSRSAIIAVCSPNNRKQSCKGLHWAYKDEYDKNPDQYVALVNKPAIKYTIRQIRCIETGEVFNNATIAALKFNTTKQSVLTACKKGWRAKGYHFEFYNRHESNENYNEKNKQIDSLSDSDDDKNKIIPKVEIKEK